MRSSYYPLVGIVLFSISSLADAQAEPRETQAKPATSATSGLKELRDEVRAAIKASDRVTKQNRDDAVRRLVAVHQRVKQSTVTGDERDTLERRVEARFCASRGFDPAPDGPGSSSAKRSLAGTTCRSCATGTTAASSSTERGRVRFRTESSGRHSSSASRQWARFG